VSGFCSIVVDSLELKWIEIIDRRRGNVVGARLFILFSPTAYPAHPAHPPTLLAFAHPAHPWPSNTAITRRNLRPTCCRRGCPITTTLGGQPDNRRGIKIVRAALLTHRALVYTPLWSILHFGLYRSVVYTKAWSIPKLGLYSTLVYTPLWSILHFGLYSTLVYTPLWSILHFGLYQSLVYTKAWSILHFGLYSTLVYTNLHYRR